MKHISILTDGDIFAPSSRVIINERPMNELMRDGLYAQYDAERVNEIYDWLISEYSRPIFGEFKIVERIEKGEEKILVIKDSAYSVDLSIFAFLTGKQDGECACSLPFQAKRKIDSPTFTGWATVVVDAQKLT